MADFVAPVARSVFLCFHVTDAGGGKVHLGWVFDVIRADAYPWTQAGICVVMQLSDGLGPVPLSLSMGRLSDGLDEEEDLQLLLEMEPTIIHFEDRLELHRVVLRLPDYTFPSPGLYTVVVHAGDEYLGDAVIRLLD